MTQRLEVLVKVFSPGAIASDVARRCNVSRGLIYQWRRPALRQMREMFVPTANFISPL